MAVCSESSKVWLHEYVNDHYVHMAQKDGHRARAAYKLLEINRKDKLIKPDIVLADLDSTPGSWSQVATKLVGKTGAVFVLDILLMDATDGVSFIQGDFREGATLEQFEVLLDNRPLDLVICDMAPNMSGNAITDQIHSFYLCELTSDFVSQHLEPGGSFLVKVFQGAGYQEYTATTNEIFVSVQIRKPGISRNRFSEIYLLGKNKRQQCRVGALKFFPSTLSTL